MPFLQRNLYYLRASPNAVLQTTLYLDPSNLRWMNSGLYQSGEEEEVDLTEDNDWETSYNVEARESTGDRVLALALNELRYKIMPKLKREAREGDLLSSNRSSTKGKVETYVGESFQMAYFFRDVSGRHAVLLKDKQLTFPAKKTEMPPPMLPASAMRTDEGTRTELRPSRLAERQQDSNEESHVLSEGIALEAGNDAEAQVQHEMQRKRRRESSASFHVKEEDEESNRAIDLDIDASGDTEAVSTAAEMDFGIEDKKPRLQVSYSGFKIFGKSLVIVIEPTRKAKRSRPALFRDVERKEVHQLSATPIPDEERQTPFNARRSQSIQRSSSVRAPSTRLFRSRRSDSLASNVDEDDEEDRQGQLARADSRRTANTGLFRGTPSEWEPTPSPAPESGQRRSKEASAAAQEVERDTAAGSDDEDKTDEDIEASQSVLFATQMMETDVASERTNDLDEDS